MRDRSLWLGLCIVLNMLLIQVPAAHARIFINIDSPAGNRLPLAVTDLRSMEHGAERPEFLRQFRKILERDLKMSGLFRLLEPDSFLEPPTAGLTTDTTNFTLWKNVGADAVVKGGFSKSGSTYTMELRLFDVQLQTDIVGKRYHFAEEDFAQAVHKFADQIILKLTGESGVFSNTLILAAKKNIRIKEIVSMDPNGGHLKQLTHHQSISLSPDISRDGRYVAYTSYASRNPDLYLLDLRKNMSRNISNRPGLNLGASFSPASNLLALAMSDGENPKLFLLDYSGQIKRQLTNNFWMDLEPSWSPDGKSLTFVSTFSGKPHIYRCNADGSEVKRLTYKGFHNVSPAWSPRGNKIAFAGKDQGYFDIFIMNTDGTEIQRLTMNVRNNEAPAWSANGQMLVFSSDRSGTDQLYVMAADGTGQTRITFENGEFSTPAWSSWIRD